MPYPKKTLKLVVLPALVAAAAVAAAVGATATSPPNLDRALEEQLALAVERPADVQVLNDLGNLLLLAGRPEEAEDAYRRALEIEPDSISVLYNLGLMLQQLGRPRAALDVLDEVLELEPRNAWAHYQVGRSHDALGHEDRAIRHYAAAFALDPQLAFPEVNPQVIDNRHLTEAMLIAYRDAPSIAEVPKNYADPGRIAALLIRTPQAEGEGEGEAAGAAAEPAPADGGSGGSAVGGDPAARPEGPGMRPRPALAPTDGEEAGRTLTPGDLERDRGLNQAQPSRGGTPRYRGGTRVETPPGNPGVDAQGRVLPSRPSPPRYTPPPNPGRSGGFSTGRPSTGRLDTHLVPADRLAKLGAGG